MPSKSDPIPTWSILSGENHLEDLRIPPDDPEDGVDLLQGGPHGLFPLIEFCL
jgi:hypothetical protein